MDTFNIVAGAASIVGLVIAVFTVPKLIKKISIKSKSKNSHNSQTSNIKGDNNGNITQIIGDKNNVQ